MTRKKPSPQTGAELYQRMVRRLAAQNATIRRLKKALSEANGANQSVVDALKHQLDVAHDALTMHQDEMQTLRARLDAIHPEDQPT